ncbi:hypothetical protein JKP88DRAFT_251589 [Tribonema minus]|uniref:Uncharacterized protein n=1 Tax=Tribonema minus TaxID=303371 RepID=A0A836CN11_9STRA|nr:hypothetical protein JKP88DRAFT_251589 [Tribonema minus]
MDEDAALLGHHAALTQEGKNIAKQVAAVANVIALRKAVKTAENGVRDAELTQQQTKDAAIDADKALAVQNKAVKEIAEQAMFTQLQTKDVKAIEDIMKQVRRDCATAMKLRKAAKDAATAATSATRRFDQAVTALGLASRAADDARSAANVPAEAIADGVEEEEDVHPMEDDVYFDDDETAEPDPTAAEEKRTPGGGVDDAETCSDDRSVESSSGEANATESADEQSPPTSSFREAAQGQGYAMGDGAEGTGGDGEGFDNSEGEDEDDDSKGDDEDDDGDEGGDDGEDKDEWAQKRLRSYSTGVKAAAKKPRRADPPVTPSRHFKCPCGVCVLDTGCPCGCASLDEHERKQRQHFRAVLGRDSGNAQLVRAAMRVAEDTKGEGEACDVVFTAPELKALIASKHVPLKTFNSAQMAKHSGRASTRGAFFIPHAPDNFKISSVFFEC